MKFSYVAIIIFIVGIVAWFIVEYNPSDIGKSAVADNPVPKQLAEAFPKTDWSKFNPKLADAISGGPGRDGIPAIDTPEFIPLNEYLIADDVQAVVLQDGEQTKVYPYNILVWHEVVNDVAADTPVAVNFCPLCGSAIVYDRTLPDGQVSTFGVTGSLLESNMIMYDRLTESMWQQSTGIALAGTYLGEKLTLVPFQLLTISDIRNTYPNALVLSEDTGYSRDYQHNPYAGYDASDQFMFTPSSTDTRFDPKTIMVVFEAAGTTFTTPWLPLIEAETKIYSTDNDSYTLFVNETGELTITTIKNESIPFYFEMWFSAATQHGDNLIVIE